jgi:hypothetical protein
VVSKEGGSTNPSKIESILKWPQSTDIKQLHSFMGLAGYYHKFIQNFAVIAWPLYDLLKKGVLHLDRVPYHNLLNSEVCPYDSPGVGAA